MVSKLNYIHYFRAVAILFIVAGHSIDIFSWPDQDNLERWLRIFISNGSALFVFIAGYLFQHLIKKFDAKKYYKNKITNVILPYIIVSTPAIILFVFFMQRPDMPETFYQQSIPQQIISFIITGSHLAPFWFVPMITLFYLIAVPLKILDNQRKFYLLIPAFMVVSCLIPRGLPYQSFIHFFAIYVLGMFCSHYKDSVNSLISKPAALVATGTAVIAFAAAEFIYMTGTMTWINFLQKCCMSVFFLGLLFRFNHKLNSALVSKVADYSFGVFFIHSYIISSGKLLYAKMFGVPATFNVLLYITCIVLTFAVCLGIVELVKYVLKDKSKYLVGS
ncbi:acyltransferase [Rheinheimera texasensis]|uniref:acyltransferase n=1 Tax=Rheinheimera texasensis TaxID=306205 RepID=UPI0004E23CA4|nr:acyltransferase [Rheinheimera texasensis]